MACSLNVVYNNYYINNNCYKLFQDVKHPLYCAADMSPGGRRTVGIEVGGVVGAVVVLVAGVLVTVAVGIARHLQGQRAGRRAKTTPADRRSHSFVFRRTNTHLFA